MILGTHRRVRAAEVGAGGVAAHDHDVFGAEPLGGEHGE